MFDIVYLKTDPEQHKRMITGFRTVPGAKMVQLTFGVEYSEHYEEEISDQKNLDYL